MRTIVRLIAGVACSLMLIPAFAAAQQGTTISGKVTSEAGTPLASVSVFIEGMNVGTITRDDGAYTIVVPAARATGPSFSVSLRGSRGR